MIVEVSLQGTSPSHSPSIHHVVDSVRSHGDRSPGKGVRFGEILCGGAEEGHAGSWAGHFLFSRY
jgi:hypothetical protein